MTVMSAGGFSDLPGFGSVPPKLIRRILAKEYVGMWELLPDSWQVELKGTCCHAKRPRRSFITDINLWAECFTTMAAILSSAFPAKAPQLFAYFRTITKASLTFEGPAWASYDMAFRRQAANRGSLDWGTVDAALYNEAFAGRAKVIPRCRYSLADTHASHNCLHATTEGQASQAVDGRPGWAPPCPLGQTQAGRPGSVEIFHLFNSPGGSRCRFPQCRYAHVCSKCRRPHSAAECGDRHPLTSTPLGAGSRAGSPPLPPPPPPPQPRGDARRVPGGPNRTATRNCSVDNNACVVQLECCSSYIILFTRARRAHE